MTPQTTCEMAFFENGRVLPAANFRNALEHISLHPSCSNIAILSTQTNQTLWFGTPAEAQDALQSAH